MIPQLAKKFLAFYRRPDWHFPLGFPAQNLHAFLFPCMCTTWLAHLIHHDLITLASDERHR